ncbi:MAG TPA: ChrR family anti-sigma-E factor [Stellaceae bacterium]|nr:ChrR family anti-sigma-E factor [Stellaceae bacterium]
MTPRQHPSEATLLAYAAGSLTEALALVTASHLSYCPDCRHQVAEAEAIGGSMLESLAPVALETTARDRVFALLDRPEARLAARPTQPFQPVDPRLPAPLARYLHGGLENIPWRFLAPGIRHFEVLPHDVLRGGNLRILRIGPGKCLPRHGHTGTELTLVLSGSYSDELGRYGSGDIGETDDDIVHEPISGRDEDCICVIATEGPLKFDSLLARTIQRFTGF